MHDAKAEPVFDGHNDVLLRLFNKHRAGVEHDFINGDNEGHLDLPRMRTGGFGGGMFAVYIPSVANSISLDDKMQGESYDVPLSQLIRSHEALPKALAMAAILFRIERASAGAFKVCRTAPEVRACFASGIVAAVLHLEGAEVIGKDLHGLEVLYQAGLRSLGPVWSRPTIFGHGVPFRYPSTGDTGPGLTDTGKALIRACDGLGVAIDLSHLNEKGFWDVAKISRRPLIATHSNAHAVCPHSRNLTDRQLDAIRDTGGIAGLNFATCFLRPDGQRSADTPVELMLRHLDHLIAKLGIDHVGFGSDFDGALIPAAIKDVTGLPTLQAALRAHGYDDEALRKLCRDNWISALETAWA